MEEREIERLVDRFERSSLDHLQITDDSFELVLSKPGSTLAVATTTTPMLQAQPASVEPAAAATTNVGTPVTAPLVGVVYFAPQPDAPVFKQVGDHVDAGEVVCLIEAMKMVNEVKAPVAGVLASIAVEDGTLVEFEQPLMHIDAEG
ncbi:acetyl-CoA carboxylase biotin carboxyl carrier protein [Lacticaseibacillus thailandensis]|nr:biotin/lipoyl-containing protein [Lacticaseibacillus thailandensis]